MKTLLLLLLIFVALISCNENKYIDEQFSTKLYHTLDDDKKIMFTSEAIHYTEEKCSENVNVKPTRACDMSVTERYIHKYKQTAIDEHKLFGIPASITLAQGILESGNGLSTLASKDNAHFGIKPGPWTGEKKLYVTKEWDKKLKRFVEVKAYFRTYPSAWWSFRNRSHFLTKTPRYKPCFTCGDDYKCWAKQLQKCGYATDPNYAKSLISVIKRYKLYQYDI